MVTKKKVSETRAFVEWLLEQRLKELAHLHVTGERNAIINAAGSVKACEDFLKLLALEERTASS